MAVVTAQPEQLRHDAVAAIRADQHGGARLPRGVARVAVASPGDGDPVGSGLEGGRLAAGPEVGTCGLRLLHEEVVEALALRHQHHGALARALERGAKTDPEAHRVDARLDDRLHREGQLLDGTQRQAAAAGLVTREAGAVEQQHRASGGGEPVGGGRTAWPCTHHDDVELLHGCAW